MQFTTCFKAVYNRLEDGSRPAVEQMQSMHEIFLRGQPNPRQRPDVEIPMETGGGPPPPPWDAAAGSVPDLLTELGSALKPYAATLAEYEYERVAQLQALGRDGLREELRGLGVTWDHRDKLCSLAFSPRPCGSLGGAFSRAFLEAARPLHAAHMGCENMVRVRVRVGVSVSVSVSVRVRVRVRS